MFSTLSRFYCSKDTFFYWNAYSFFQEPSHLAYNLCKFFKIQLCSHAKSLTFALCANQNLNMYFLTFHHFFWGGKYKISSFRPLFSNHLPISKKSSTFAYVKSAYNTISLILRHDLIYQLLCRRARFIRTSIGGLDFFYPFRNGIQNPDFFCLYRANQDNKKY